MTNLAINLTIDTTLQSTILPASIEALNFDKLKFKQRWSHMFEQLKAYL